MIFMTFSPITLSQREKAEKIRKQYGNTQSAWHAFHSLLIWQTHLGLTIHLEDDFFAVRYGAAGENCYYMPCGKPEKVLRFLEELRQQGDFRLFFANQSDVRFLREQVPFPLHFQYDRDSSEYLYDVDAHCSMKGTRFSKLRYEIRQLEQAHRMTSKPLDNSDKEAVETILRAWAEQKHLEYGRHEGDLDAVISLFRNGHTLGVRGIMVFMDGMPAAIAAGAPLSEEGCDLCLYKQSVRERGLGIYTFRKFVEQLQGTYRFINMEEDIGIPGLRIHKQKLQPDGMSHMWEAVYGNAY